MGPLSKSIVEKDQMWGSRGCLSCLFKLAAFSNDPANIFMTQAANTLELNHSTLIARLYSAQDLPGLDEKTWTNRLVWHLLVLVVRVRIIEPASNLFRCPELIRHKAGSSVSW